MVAGAGAMVTGTEEAPAGLDTVEVTLMIWVEVNWTGLGVALGPVGLRPAAEHSMDCNMTSAWN